MPDKEDEREIQAVAVLTLLDMDNEDMANALMGCKLSIRYWSNGTFDELEIAGREANLRKLRAHPFAQGTLVVNEAVYFALKSSVTSWISGTLTNSGTRIILRTVLSVPLAYQEEVRKIIESAGIDGPAIGGLRVRREGHEYQLKPISIFPVGTFERDAKLCFVLMPFAPGFQPIYEQGIKPAIEAQSLTCQRGDDILQAGDIIGQIWGSLIQARLVVADLTGANGNVLYELGLAHMMGHQAILLAQDISAVPFDLRQQRHIIYSPSESSLQKLSVDLGQAIKAMLAQ